MSIASPPMTQYGPSRDELDAEPFWAGLHVRPLRYRAHAERTNAAAEAAAKRARMGREAAQPPAVAADRDAYRSPLLRRLGGRSVHGGRRRAGESKQETGSALRSLNSRTRRSLVLVASCGTIGCATVATLTFTSRIEEEMYNNPKELQSLPRVYSGTIADAYCVSQFAQPILLCLIDLRSASPAIRSCFRTRSSGKSNREVCARAAASGSVNPSPGAGNATTRRHESRVPACYLIRRPPLLPRRVAARSWPDPRQPLRRALSKRSVATLRSIRSTPLERTKRRRCAPGASSGRLAWTPRRICETRLPGPVSLPPPWRPGQRMYCAAPQHERSAKPSRTATLTKAWSNEDLTARRKKNRARVDLARPRSSTWRDGVPSPSKPLGSPASDQRGRLLAWK